MISLIFLHGDIHQGKGASETTNFGWVFPDMHTQNLPRLTMSTFG